jgi:hypothetical protein
MSGIMSLVAYGAQDLYLTGGRMVTICHQGCECTWPNYTRKPIMICRIEKLVIEWDLLFRDQSKTTNVLPRDMFELIKKHIRDHPKGGTVCIGLGESVRG